MNLENVIVAERLSRVLTQDIFLKWKLKYFYQFWQVVWWPIQNYSLNYTIYDQVYTAEIPSFVESFLANIAYRYKRQFNFNPDLFVDRSLSRDNFKFNLDNLPPDEQGPLVKWILDYFNPGQSLLDEEEQLPHMGPWFQFQTSCCNVYNVNMRWTLFLLQFFRRIKPFTVQLVLK